jgi:hypothetical protein
MVASSREFFAARFAELDQNRIATRHASNSTNAAFDSITLAPVVASKAESDPHLNDSRKYAKRLEALEPMFADLERARGDLAKMKSEAEVALGKLALPELEPGDLVGELRDQEARALVRAMPQKKRDRLDRLSPALAKAVVRADPALSGASESVHKRIRDELLEVAHPQKLAALRNDLRAHEMGSHVVDRADKALREAAKFAPGEERPFLERVRASAARPKPKAGIDPNDIDALIAERRKRIGLSAPRAL